MTDGLKDFEIRMMKYAIAILLFILTSCVGYLLIAHVGYPDRFVRLERYLNDQQKIESNLKDIKDDTKDIMKLLLKERDK